MYFGKNYKYSESWTARFRFRVCLCNTHVVEGKGTLSCMFEEMRVILRTEFQTTNISYKFLKLEAKVRLFLWEVSQQVIASQYQGENSTSSMRVSSFSRTDKFLGIIFSSCLI